MANQMTAMLVRHVIEHRSAADGKISIHHGSFLIEMPAYRFTTGLIVNVRSAGKDQESETTLAHE